MTCWRRPNKTISTTVSNTDRPPLTENPPPQPHEPNSVIPSQTQSNTAATAHKQQSIPLDESGAGRRAHVYVKSRQIQRAKALLNQRHA